MSAEGYEEEEESERRGTSCVGYASDRARFNRLNLSFTWDGGLCI